MNLRRLQSFLAVANCRSFRLAAERLSRSQSVVSTHVQQLEEELGVPLLTRTTRSVKLTREGETLMVRSTNVLVELDAVAQELRDEAQLRRGRVCIGCSPSIATNRLPPILSLYQSRYPGIRLELHEDFAKNMYDRVSQEVTDFAVGPRMDELKHLAFDKILSDPIVAILPKDYPLAGRTKIGLREIARHPHLAMPRGTAIRTQLEKAYLSIGVTLAPRFEIVHQQTLFSMVEAGLGIAVSPGVSVPTSRQNSGYQVVPVAAPSITREICLVTLRNKVLSPPARACADLIRKMLRDASGGTPRG